MKTSDVLYMFAIVPPVAVAGAVQQERLAFADKYGFVKGLKPPVHITLFPPFKIPVEDTAEFEQRMMVLNDWAGMQQSLIFTWMPLVFSAIRGTRLYSYRLVITNSCKRCMVVSWRIFLRLPA
jgi:hypothetical protein